jgi:hypothetical protein
MLIATRRDEVVKFFGIGLVDVSVAVVVVEVGQDPNDSLVNNVCGSANKMSSEFARLNVWHRNVSLILNALQLSPADKQSAAHSSTDCTSTRSIRKGLSTLKPVVPSSKNPRDGPPHCEGKGEVKQGKNVHSPPKQPGKRNWTKTYENR